MKRRNFLLGGLLAVPAVAVACIDVRPIKPKPVAPPKAVTFDHGYPQLFKGVHVDFGSGDDVRFTQVDYAEQDGKNYRRTSSYGADFKLAHISPWLEIR